MTQPEHSSAAMGLRWLLFWCFRLPGDGMRRKLHGIAQFNRCASTGIGAWAGSNGPAATPRSATACDRVHAGK